VGVGGGQQNKNIDKNKAKSEESKYHKQDLCVKRPIPNSLP
jgi:hypothetical protein